MDTMERIAALQEPSPRVDSYGRHECGCTWDSGPYGVYCGKHDRESLQDDVYAELREAVREVLDDGYLTRRLRVALAAVDALRDARVGTD